MAEGSSVVGGSDGFTGVGSPAGLLGVTAGWLGSSDGEALGVAEGSSDGAGAQASASKK